MRNIYTLRTRQNKSEEVEDLEEVVREEVEEVVVEIANQEDDEEVVNEVVK